MVNLTQYSTQLTKNYTTNSAPFKILILDSYRENLLHLCIIFTYEEALHDSDVKHARAECGPRVPLHHPSAANFRHLFLRTAVRSGHDNECFYLHHLTDKDAAPTSNQTRQLLYQYSRQHLWVLLAHGLRPDLRHDGQLAGALGFGTMGFRFKFWRWNGCL
ncbi:hypothetical protein CEXT_232121 [Caerostris extrusa]|uniref:Uncharacterized protein n=1 Tax=Caerostris extrusa TaxID=172846 RepID=A0AAV4SZP4_CAEEX|nr:hypothetical protein CEXT_232121 [Caerostris extrusa]